MRPTRLTVLCVFSSVLLFAQGARTAPASRGLPLILFNNDSDDLKWAAYGHELLWSPTGEKIPIKPIRSLEEYLGYRIGPLADTAAKGLAYCGNFGLPVWELKRDRISALGEDPLLPILQYWKRDGRAFYFSMRMNDIHHETFNWPHLWGNFQRENRGLFLKPPSDEQWKTQFLPWLDGNGKKPTIAPASLAYDYSRADVRKQFLSTLREASRRYNLDGVELDWLRYPKFFRDSEVNAETITAFVGEVHAILAETARSRGHAVRLISRLPDSPAKALAIGLDVETWLKNGWLDAVIGGHGGIFSASELEQWVELGHRFRVPVYGALERHHFGVRGFAGTASAENLRAAVATLWHKGADGLYLFNYYTRSEYPLLDEFADPSRLVRAPKQYFLEGNLDVSASGSNGTRSVGPLPVDLKAGEKAQVSLIVVDDAAAAKDVQLEIVWKSAAGFAPPTVRVNGQEMTGMKISAGKSSITSSISSASLKKALIRGKNQFAFEASQPALLTALSVRIIP